MKSIGLMAAEAVDRAFTRRRAAHSIEQIKDAAYRVLAEGKITPAVGVVKFRKGGKR